MSWNFEWQIYGISEQFSSEKKGLSLKILGWCDLKKISDKLKYLSSRILLLLMKECL